VIDLEARLGRILAIGTWVGVAALVLGVILMAGSGISPLEPTFPALEPSSLLADLASFEAAAWLWVGLVVVIATPILRVGAALIGFAGRGELDMAAVSVGILVVVVVGVLIGTGGG
jgi:uncharacterized membrane protein